MRSLSRGKFTSRVSTRRPNTSYLISLLAALTYSGLGFILTIPFAYMIAFGEHQPNISLLRILFVVLAVIGWPLFLFGLIGIVGKRGATASTLEGDVSRIRFTAETHAINDVMNNMKGK